MVFVLFVLMLFFSVALNGALSESQGCRDMNDLIPRLRFANTSELQCETSPDCSSLHCRNKTHSESTAGFTILSCDDEPILELEANIPSFGISSWIAKVGDGSFLPINGVTYPQASNKQGYVQTNVKKSSTENAIILSVTIKGCELDNKQMLKQSSCAEMQIISEQKLTCPNRMERQPALCSISKLFDCQSNEACRQIGQTSKGECICHDENGGSCGSLTTSHASSTPAPSPSLSSPLVPIVASFLICTAGVALCYAFVKFQVFQRARAALTRNRFRRVLLVQDFDNDDDPTLA